MRNTAEQTELPIEVVQPPGGLAEITAGWATFPTELAREASAGAIARYCVIVASYFEGVKIPRRLDQYDPELLAKGFLVRREGKIYLAD